MSQLPADRTHTLFRADIDTDFVSSTRPRTANVRLDTSSRFYLFTGEIPSTSMPTGDVASFSFFGPWWAARHCADGICSPSFGGQPVTMGNVWEVPFDGWQFDDTMAVNVSYRPQADAPIQRIASPMPSARNYDVGICDITITYPFFAALINRAVFPQVLAGVKNRIVSFRDTSEERVWVGGLLRANPDGTSSDRFAIRLEQVLRVHALLGPIPLTPEVLAAEQLTFTPSLVERDGANAIRLELNDASPTFVNYPIRYISHQIESAAITTELGGKLPEQLENALNDTLRPLVLASTGRLACDPTASDATAQCRRAIDRDYTANTTVGALPATCVPFARLNADEQQSSRRSFCRQLATGKPLEQIGICAARISPTRVQVLPHGLQLVLADSATDPRLPQLRTVVIPTAARTAGVEASCDDSRERAINALATPRDLLQQVNSTGEGPAISCSGATDSAGSCEALISSAAPTPLPTCE